MIQAAGQEGLGLDLLTRAAWVEENVSFPGSEGRGAFLLLVRPHMLRGEDLRLRLRAWVELLIHALVCRVRPSRSHHESQITIYGLERLGGHPAFQEEAVS